MSTKTVCRVESRTWPILGAVSSAFSRQMEESAMIDRTYLALVHVISHGRCRFPILRAVLSTVLPSSTQFHVDGSSAATRPSFFLPSFPQLNIVETAFPCLGDIVLAAERPIGSYRRLGHTLRSKRVSRGRTCLLTLSLEYYLYSSLETLTFTFTWTAILVVRHLFKTRNLHATSSILSPTLT